MAHITFTKHRKPAHMPDSKAKTKEIVDSSVSVLFMSILHAFYGRGVVFVAAIFDHLPLC